MKVAVNPMGHPRRHPDRTIHSHPSPRDQTPGAARLRGRGFGAILPAAAAAPSAGRFASAMEFVRFKHARFSARFPATFRYARSHYWMARDENDPALWRVGFTKFAARMLGELVEARFDLAEGDPVEPGQQIGYVEGFKAASDLYCTMRGKFAGGNPLLDLDACLVRTSPYEDGWLYAVRGEPEPESVDVHGYVAHLEALIEQMQLDPKYADA